MSKKILHFPNKNLSMSADAIQEINLDLWDTWIKKQRENKLLQFFFEYNQECDSSIDVFSDLNALKIIEEYTNFKFILFHPGMLNAYTTGFIVQFKIDENIVCTPALNTENLARVYGLILFKKLSLRRK